MNKAPVLVSNSVAISFLKENGRPKNLKGKYFLFFFRGISGEIDIASSEEAW